MIIIHAADIHLGSTLGGLDQHEGLPVDIIRAAPLTAFERIADLCAERGADLLLLAGDLFDRDASLATIRDATRVLKRITSGGTRVVTLRGNHDAVSRMQRRLPQIDGLHELSSTEPETLVLDELGVAVHGRGFDTQHVTENIVRAYPARIDGALNLGLLHTSLEGNAAHAVYAPCELADLVALGYDYWALGHIHQHAVLRDAPWVVYAGSPQGRHIGEVGDHGVYVLRVEEGSLVGAPEHVELGSVRWHRVEVAASAEDDDAEVMVARARDAILETIEPYGTGVRHIVRLELTGRCAAHVELHADPDRWRDELRLAADGIASATVHVERVRMKTSPPLPDPGTLRERHDVIGKLARHLAAEELARLESGELLTRNAPAAFTQLDAKLRPLADAAAALRGTDVATDELAAATDDLLARLLVASASAAEEGR
ncbi:MAG: metallophosphoesterase [Thermoleophilia bacterium]|nr:metallophosphoesterase [Thermoleophilia bacterium]